MQCFNLKKIEAQYLDQSLPQVHREALHQHLQQCQRCQLKYQHYQEIIQQIQQWPYYRVTEALKKKPLPGLFSKETLSALLTYWKRIPWYLRILIESNGLIGLILFMISLTPTLRTAYKTHLEKRLLTLKSKVLSTPNLLEDFQSDFSLDSPEEDQPLLPPALTKKKTSSLRQTHPQLLRCIVKTHQVHELGKKMIQTLKTLGLQCNAPTRILRGLEIKLVVPSSSIPQIETFFEMIPQYYKISEKNFQWYRHRLKYQQLQQLNKHKKSLKGQHYKYKESSLVVIWIFHTHETHE